MHLAPSVSYPVGRCVLGERMWLLHSLCGVVLWLFWGLAQPVTMLWWAVGVFLTLESVWGLPDLRQRPMTLNWGDAGWVVASPSSATTPALFDVGRVKPVMDLQNTLLLQWQPLSFTLRGRRWLWLTQSACPEQWLDLRRAVYGPSC